MGEEVEFLLIMASPKHVLPTGAYLNLTVIYRTGHTEKTTKLGSAVHISLEFPPEKNPQEQNHFCVVFLSISFERHKNLNIFLNIIYYELGNDMHAEGQCM